MEDLINCAVISFFRWATASNNVLSCLLKLVLQVSVEGHGEGMEVGVGKSIVGDNVATDGCGSVESALWLI